MGGVPVLRPFCSWPSFMLSIFVLLKSIIRPDFGPCNFIAPAIELPIETGDSYGGAVAQYLLPAEDPVAEWQRGKMEEDAHDQAFNRLPVLIKNAAIDTKKFFIGNYDPTIFVHLFAGKLDDTTTYCKEFILRGIAQVVAVHGNSQESLGPRRVYSWNNGTAQCLERELRNISNQAAPQWRSLPVAQYVRIYFTASYLQSVPPYGIVRTKRGIIE